MSTTIEVFRPPYGRLLPTHALSRYRVVIDDREVARLKDGDAHVEHVDPGSHRVEVRVSGSRSPELWLDLADEEPVRVVVQPARSILSIGYRRRNSALDLQVA